MLTEDHDNSHVYEFKLFLFFFPWQLFFYFWRFSQIALGIKRDPFPGVLQNPCPFTLRQVASLSLFLAHSSCSFPRSSEAALGVHWPKHRRTRGQEQQQAQHPGRVGMVLFLGDVLVLSTGFLEKGMPDLAFDSFRGVCSAIRNPPAMQDTWETRV